MKFLEFQNVVISVDKDQFFRAKSVALIFAELGANVAILGVNKSESENLIKMIGDSSMYIECDIYDKDSCENACKLVVDKWNKIDALVNFPGMAQEKSFIDISPEKLSSDFSHSIFSMVCMVQTVSRYMKKASKGSIVNVMPSDNSMCDPSCSPHYGALKDGLVKLCRSFAKELAPSNLRVNVITPGFINGGSTQGNLSFGAYECALSRIPLKRAGNVEDISGSCVFLASSLSSFITGMEISVDGGTNYIGGYN